MSSERGRLEPVDLERTDRLPTWPGGVVDPDVLDDAVPLDITATYVQPPGAADEPRPSDPEASSPEPPNPALDTRLHDALRDASHQRQDADALRGTLRERERALAEAQGVLAERERHVRALQQEQAEQAALLAAQALAAAQHAAELEGARARCVAVESELEAERARLAAQLEAERARWAGELEAERAQRPAAHAAQTSPAAELERAADALAFANSKVTVLTEDNRALRSALADARSALEERDFLIRRLERGEGAAAPLFDRVPAGAGRSPGAPLGTAASGTPPFTAASSGGPPFAGVASAAVAPPPPERRAELIGAHGETYVLGRRTRIGRSPGCDLQLDYSSVSRLHAQVLNGSRDVVVEDLSSTNGVLVNGRKITRQFLNDGDLIVIGEVQLRLALRAAPGDSPPPEGGIAPTQGPFSA